MGASGELERAVVGVVESAATAAARAMLSLTVQRI